MGLPHCNQVKWTVWWWMYLTVTMQSGQFGGGCTSLLPCKVDSLVIDVPHYYQAKCTRQSGQFGDGYTSLLPCKVDSLDMGVPHHYHAKWTIWSSVYVILPGKVNSLDMGVPHHYQAKWTVWSWMCFIIIMQNASLYYISMEIQWSTVTLPSKTDLITDLLHKHNHFASKYIINVYYTSVQL